MPNWVYNGLTIEGNPESVEKLVNQMNQPFALIHDTWDRATQSHMKKRTLYPNPVFAFWNIVKPDNLAAYNDTSSEESRKHLDYWYQWNIREWGVKWDVAVQEGDEHPDTYMEGIVRNGENAVVYYNFNTAWSIAGEALSKLSLQYPDLLFTLAFEEETGWGGEIEFLNGSAISRSEYETKCNDCDSINVMEYCEECENTVCSECKYGAVDNHEQHVMETTNA